MDKLVLVIYPQALATRIAIYDNRKPSLLINIKHPAEVISGFSAVLDQTEYRYKTIVEEIEKAHIDISDISAVVGRGGLLKPITGGVYQVNEAMLNDTKNPMGEHESNLGCILAFKIAQLAGNDVPALIVDPACVDEMQPEFRLSGLPDLPRKSILHTLNQRTIARRFAREIGHSYDEISVIVAHLSKGISIGAHKNGKIIDVNNGLIGDGPMSTERSGGLPSEGLVELCFSKKYSREEVLNILKNKGGILAYTGISSINEIEKRLTAGEEHLLIAINAMIAQIAKEIAALSASLMGKVDGVLLTGDLAHSNLLVNGISERIRHIGNIRIYPGDDDMYSLALHGYMVLDNEIEPKKYV